MTVKRRPGGRSARVRAAVLTATLGELGAVGYAQLSLEGIARRAGVNRTTVYRRWGTREALLLDAMLTRADEVVPVPDTGSLREDLVQLARAAVANASSPEVEPLVRTVIAELHHKPALRDASLRFWGERMSLDGAIVERAIARGDVPADTHSRSVIEAVLGPLHMRLLVSGTPPDEAAIERVVDLVVAAVTR